MRLILENALHIKKFRENRRDHLLSIWLTKKISWKNCGNILTVFRIIVVIFVIASISILPFPGIRSFRSYNRYFTFSMYQRIAISEKWLPFFCRTEIILNLISLPFPELQFEILRENETTKNVYYIMYCSIKVIIYLECEALWTFLSK